MGYLDKSGLSRLWSKIKSYVTNHHMTVNGIHDDGGVTSLTFGDTFNETYPHEIDKYGHIISKYHNNITLPTVECGTLELGSSIVGVKFANMKNTPKLIKIYFIDQSSEYGHSSKDLCSVWYDGESVVSTHGIISSVSQTGFSFIGNPGKHYWEAWG